MRVSRIVVVMVTAVLAGVLTSSTAAARTKSAQWDPRIQPLVSQVEQLRGLHFKHPVPVKFLDKAAFEKKVSTDEAKLSATEKADLSRNENQLRAVGLIGGSVDLLHSVNDLKQSGVLAYYSPKSKSVTVKGRSVDDVGVRVTLIHELTHALQDQYFDLQKMERDARKLHAESAVRTLVEGDAVRVQNAYTKTLSQADQDAYRNEQRSESGAAHQQQAANGVPDALQVLFEAPYDFGPVMLQAVIAANHTDGVDALFRSPPRNDSSYLTPITLLDPPTFPDVARPKLNKGEKRVGKTDSFGALALYIMLAGRIDQPTALAAADGWGGDSELTFARSTKTCTRVDMAGQTLDDTKRIRDALTAWSATMPPGMTQVTATTNRVGFTACADKSTDVSPTQSMVAALALAVNRDELFAGLLQEGIDSNVAECAANGIVRAPEFAPFLADPNAEPDEAAIATLRSVVMSTVRTCAQSGGSA
jgi:hypothetical protein